MMIFILFSQGTFDKALQQTLARSQKNISSLSTTTFKVGSGLMTSNVICRFLDLQYFSDHQPSFIVNIHKLDIYASL